MPLTPRTPTNITQISHPSHLVEPSPWPVIAAAAALITTLGLAAWFHNYGTTLLTLGILLLLTTASQWWRDILREAVFQGHHTSYVARGLRIGIIIFIASEAMFFLAFFWAFFHSALAPTPETGCTWPPLGIEPLNPFAVPLLNTSLLLLSGLTITLAHMRLIQANRTHAAKLTLKAALLGVLFTICQVHEYICATFTIADGIYGRTFFIATGFHGLHVLIGTTFILVCVFRFCSTFLFAPLRHVGFEAAAWYWHFVDVIWICLYLCIYWWGA